MEELSTTVFTSDYSKRLCTEQRSKITWIQPPLIADASGLKCSLEKEQENGTGENKTKGDGMQVS